MFLFFSSCVIRFLKLGARVRLGVSFFISLQKMVTFFGKLRYLVGW